MTRELTLLVAALSLSGLTALSAVKDTPPAKRGTAPVLERLKGLEGTWVELGADGQPTDKVVSTYRVTAGGSAVVETLFPDTDHEMITVYHQDGHDVMLTHYCVLGNQPRMRIAGQTTSNILEFECAGGTNMTSENDAHMHQVTLELVEKDHFKARWLQFKDGKQAEAVAFDLTRKSDSVR